MFQYRANGFEWKEIYVGDMFYGRVVAVACHKGHVVA